MSPRSRMRSDGPIRTNPPWWFADTGLAFGHGRNHQGERGAHMKRLLLLASAGVGMAIVAVGAAIAPALAGDGPLSPEVQEIRAAVAKYHSFEQAERDGYTVEGEPCVSSPPAPPSPDGGGTMGIHAINPPLLGDLAIDQQRPEILLYVP